MKTALLIDGSNFYHRLKRCCIRHSSAFDYKRFSEFLMEVGDQLSYVGYYVGLVRRQRYDSSTQRLYLGQQQLFSNLRHRFPGIRIVLGHIQNTHGVFQEKGVDVRLALDLYRLACEQGVEKIILVSSDADLLPAVELAQKMGCVSQALLRNCRRKRVLLCSDLKQFEQL